jgi:hypothetical protein
MQCGHRDCTCLVEADARFCSSHCERMAEDPLVDIGEPRDALVVDCGCGHIECQGPEALI